MKPVIGMISWRSERAGLSVHEINHSFASGIEEAGGIPVVYPVLEDFKTIEHFIDLIDGLMLIGGEDVAPFFYGEEPMAELRGIDLERDRTEIAAIRLAIEKGCPILGICRGLQLTNVVRGGTIYQDIPKQIGQTLVHAAPSERFEVKYHKIKIEKESHLYKIYGDSMIVNSFHHQSIKELGEGMRVVARSVDGVVEACEGEWDGFFLGVQFHPEFSEHNGDYHKIFEYFVERVRGL